MWSLVFFGFFYTFSRGHLRRPVNGSLVGPRTLHARRGSYLTFTGSRAFMQIMSSRHNFLHRQAIIARAACEPLTEADRQRLTVSTGGRP